MFSNKIADYKPGYTPTVHKCPCGCGKRVSANKVCCHASFQDKLKAAAEKLTAKIGEATGEAISNIQVGS